MLILHAFVLFYVSFDFVCSRLLSQCRKCRCRRRPLELQPLDARDTSLDGLDSVVGRSLDEVQIDLGDIAAEAPLGKRDRGEIWPRGIFLHCSWFLLHIYIYIYIYSCESLYVFSTFSMSLHDTYCYVHHIIT